MWPEDIDTSRDFEIWTNKESITYYQKLLGVVQAGVTVTDTKRFAIKKDFLPADSALLKMDIRWRIPVATLGGIVPKVDEVFKDQFDVRWIIKIVDYLSHLNNYRVACLRLQGVA